LEHRRAGKVAVQQPLTIQIPPNLKTNKNVLRAKPTPSSRQSWRKPTSGFDVEGHSARLDLRTRFSGCSAASVEGAAAAAAANEGRSTGRRCSSGLWNKALLVACTAGLISGTGFACFVADAPFFLAEPLVAFFLFLLETFRYNLHCRLRIITLMQHDIHGI